MRMQTDCVWAPAMLVAVLTLTKSYDAQGGTSFPNKCKKSQDIGQIQSLAVAEL